MKMIKYKVSIIILCVLFSSVLIINNTLTNKINEHIVLQENIAVNIKPLSKFTLYDALNEIYKYDALTVEKINLEQEYSCNIEIKYKGDINVLENILKALAQTQQGNVINDILIDKKENTAKFNIIYTLNQ